MRSYQPPSDWHSGEKAAQAARDFPPSTALSLYEVGAPDWMTLFLTQLPFISVTTVDEKGRPWTSLLSGDGSAGFIQPVPGKVDTVRVTARIPPGVPVRECLQRLHACFAAGEQWRGPEGAPRLPFLMAGVGVMLHNRRRNKFESVVVTVERIPGEGAAAHTTGIGARGDRPDDVFVFQAQITSTFGNCPKYINLRHLAPVAVASTAPAEVEEHRSTAAGQDLPAYLLQVVAAADVMFLSTRHAEGNAADEPARLGNNHRGGRAGFLRTFWDGARERRCVCLPDWSGNRLMMSLGNMLTDPVAGVAVPAWSASPHEPTGVLHLTCTSEVLAGEQARQMMPGVQGLTKLWVEEWCWVPSALPLQAPLPVGWSPYNPPLRLLACEQPDHALARTSAQNAATLVGATLWSDALATLVFEVPSGELARTYRVGQHVIVDCLALLSTRMRQYTHMARHPGGEKDLNDDGTRSWTVTHAAPSGSGWVFEVTLRRKVAGAVTPALFHMASQLCNAAARGEPPPVWTERMQVLGLDGTTMLPAKPVHETGRLHLLYLLSGIGMTPLLAHLTQLASDPALSATLLVVVATRSNEVQETQLIIHRALARVACAGAPSRIQVRLLLIPSLTPPKSTADGHAGTEDADPPSIHHILWSSLPTAIEVRVSCHPGERLSPDSLTTVPRHPSTPPITFSLPPDAAMPWHLVDMAVVCAAPPYAEVARQAAHRAGVPSEHIHYESFAY
mmetsp:Transcript_49004/g.123272  ORF Transcript_49004/g.123272 Transcript_49004/m.123272 type:complete len:732 (-) Transcript_49004:94-2289(-)